MASRADLDFIALAKARWDQAQAAEQKQRTREREDLAFYADDQWPEDVKTARAGFNATNGMPPVPARPCLVINKVRAPVRYILNEERQADLGIELVPADDFSSAHQPISDDEIELREGLIRRIQRESHARDARTWAFQRAAIAGRGYYRILTDYLPGKTFDQDIKVERIYYQASVLLDPAHEQPDGSDAAWAFIATDIPLSKYREEYGRRASGKKNALVDIPASGTDGQWTALMTESPDWFYEDDDVRMVRVVEYFYTEAETRDLVQLTTGDVVYLDELPEGVTDADFAVDEDGQPLKRRHTVRTVKWAKIDGASDEPLEKRDWAGRYIPIVKVTGEELQPYDSERRAIGVVRPARDSQRGFNAMVSKQVETVAYQPISPLQVWEGQIEGYEQWYSAAATRVLPYLPAKRYDDQGQPYPNLPERAQFEAPIQAIAASVALFQQAVSDTTNVPEPALGQLDPSVKSGKMLKFLLDQTSRGTSHFMDNMTRSVEYEARILDDLLYPIYGRPGRLAKMINAQGDAQTVLVGQPMMSAQGRPQPAPPGAPGAKTYTLTPGVPFNVAVKVSKSYDTRRQEQNAVLSELIAASPEQMGVIGDLFYESLDAPGSREMAERQKAVLVPPVQQLLSKEMQIPPAVQAQMAQAGQMIQQLTAHVNDLTEQIKTKQVEKQADLQKAQMDNATRLEIAKITAGANLAIADLKAQVQVALDTAKVAAEQVRSLVDAAEESRLARQQHEHGKEIALLEHGHSLIEAQQAHAHALAQGAQAAELQPPAEPAGVES